MCEVSTLGAGGATELDVKPNAACQSVLDATGIVSGISVVGSPSVKHNHGSK